MNPFILVKSKFRDPVEIIWNLLFPSVVFLFYNYGRLGQSFSSQQFFFEISPYISWMIIQSSMYGIGINLIIWREQAFLKTFVQSKKSLMRLALTFSISQFFSSFISCSFIVAVALIIFRIDSLSYLFLWIPLLASFGGLFVGAASIALSRFKVSVASLSSMLTMFIIASLWLASKYQDGEPFETIIYFNPIYFIIMWQSVAHDTSILLSPSFVGFNLALLGIAAWGISRFNIQAEERR